MPSIVFTCFVKNTAEEKQLTDRGIQRMLIRLMSVVKSNKIIYKFIDRTVIALCRHFNYVMRNIYMYVI